MATSASGAPGPGLARGATLCSNDAVRYALAAQASEGRFARTMRVLVSVFVEPMSDEVLSPHQASSIFRNVRAIRDTHGQLRALLDAAGEADSVAAAIDKISRGLRK